MSKERKIVGIWPSDRISSGILGVSEPIAQPAPIMPAEPLSESLAPETPETNVTEAQHTGALAPETKQTGTEPGEQPWDDAAPWLPDVTQHSDGDRGLGWPALVPALVIAAVALSWTGFVGWSQSAGYARLPAIEQWPQIAVMVAAPIAVLLLFALLVERGSARSIRRHLRILARIREEQSLMADRLSIVDRHWQSVQRGLMANVQALEESSQRAGAMVDDISLRVGENMATASAQAVTVNRHGEAAQRAMEALLVALPKIDEVAQRAIEGLRESGQIAYQFGGQLEAKIADVRGESAQTEQAVQAVIATLVSGIADLRQATSQAQNGASEASAAVEQAMASQRSAALGMMADLSSALEQQMTDSHARLAALRDNAGTATLEQAALISGALAQGEARIAAVEQSIAKASSSCDQLGRTITSLSQAVGQEVASVHDRLEEGMTAVDSGMRALTDRVSMLRQSGEHALGDAAAFAAQADGMLASLATVREEIDVTMPASLARLQSLVAAGREQIDALPLSLGETGVAVDGAIQQLRAAEASLQAQAEQVAALEHKTRQALAAQTALAGDFEQLLARLSEQMQTLATRDGAAVNSALQSIDDRAQAIISATAGRLEAALADALDRATGDAVNQRLAQVADASDQAVAAASAASDRLMRELITIADSSAALEARAAEVSSAVAAAHGDTLSRQMATLTQALHSISVDLTRILSAEVADQSWELYLKGDRSIFARRALRLLTSGEAKDILRRYEEDGEFRIQVNRYIHDFENMLRTVMDARDGAALSVTLLSSDIGKIYVALAQAIERLRH